jgi:hypothetical protein
MMKTQNALTVQLTDAQASMLQELPAYRIWKRLNNGAVIVSFAHDDAARMIVDIDGKVQGYGQYLSLLDRPALPVR